MATVYDNASLNYGTDTNIRLIELLPGSAWCDGEEFAIHCKFHVLPLASGPTYTAISYMWGHDCKTTDILLDGKRFAVRTNLFELLSKLSKTQQGLLWVDAVCINQASLHERNHQVGLMGKIYSQATNVLVWLGGDVYGVNKVLSVLKDLDELSSKDQSRVLWSREIELLLAPTLELCTHPYWSRAWIVQELILARDVYIIGGGGRVGIDIFANALRYPLKWINAKPRILGRSKAVIAISKSMASRLINKRKKWQDSFGRTYINPWDIENGILGCSDVRDRVYAMASIMDPKLSIVPDYSKTPAEIFKEIFEQHLKRTGAFVGTVWYLQPMLELDDNDPVVQRAKQFGSLEWNPFWVPSGSA